MSIGRTRIVEQRLCESSFATKGTSEPAQTGGATDEAFADVLRHELNNPRTGNLGDGEILLAEFRRKTGQLPSDRRRFETIVALAVRSREALRRLSRLRKSYCAKARADP
jgi:signal transduction histidine kinase